jgi:hypothetical protein
MTVSNEPEEMVKEVVMTLTQNYLGGTVKTKKIQPGQLVSGPFLK